MNDSVKSDVKEPEASLVTTSAEIIAPIIMNSSLPLCDSSGDAFGIKVTESAVHVSISPVNF